MLTLTPPREGVVLVTLSALAWALYVEGLEPLTKLTLIAIAESYSEWSTPPSLEQIARIVGVDERIVLDQIGVLEGLGLVARGPVRPMVPTAVFP